MLVNTVISGKSTYAGVNPLESRVERCIAFKLTAVCYVYKFVPNE